MNINLAMFVFPRLALTPLEKYRSGGNLVYFSQVLIYSLLSLCWRSNVACNNSLLVLPCLSLCYLVCKRSIVCTDIAFWLIMWFVCFAECLVLVFANLCFVLLQFNNAFAGPKPRWENVEGTSFSIFMVSKYFQSSNSGWSSRNVVAYGSNFGMHLAMMGIKIYLFPR